MSGLRILLAEDEMLVTMMIEDLLREFGCRVVGPANRLEKALRFASEETIDGAILDVNLAGQAIYPVADMLAGRGIPFVFVTGYGAAGMDDAYAQAVTLQKPFQPQDLERAIRTGILDRRT